MTANATQRRNTDEQSDDHDSPNRADCIVCSEYKLQSDYSLYVRRWDGKYVAKADICEDCVTDESAAWRYNQVADQNRESDR
ncbi:hypothetical protein [Halocatena marina]|uniref:hypothetical protein n=1 Tax=Halocatena marina TaxID=2934937 RepID=UPI00200C5A28|nr:hypothetical protein [Halocatena marina]